MTTCDSDRLCWSGHSIVLANSLYRLYMQSSLLDVRLVCDEAHIYAHKAVLAAGSQFFLERLQSHGLGMVELQMSTANLGMIITPNDLRAVVEYLYCGELLVPHHRLPQVLALVRSLQVFGFQNEGAGYLAGPDTQFLTQAEMNFVPMDTSGALMEIPVEHLQVDKSCGGGLPPTTPLPLITIKPQEQGGMVLDPPKYSEPLKIDTNVSLLGVSSTMSFSELCTAPGPDSDTFAGQCSQVKSVPSIFESSVLGETTSTMFRRTPDCSEGYSKPDNDSLQHHHHGTGLHFRHDVVVEEEEEVGEAGGGVRHGEAMVGEIRRGEAVVGEMRGGLHFRHDMMVEEEELEEAVEVGEMRRGEATVEEVRRMRQQQTINPNVVETDTDDTYSTVMLLEALVAADASSVSGVDVETLLLPPDDPTTSARLAAQSPRWIRSRRPLRPSATTVTTDSRARLKVKDSIGGVSLQDTSQRQDTSTGREEEVRGREGKESWKVVLPEAPRPPPDPGYHPQVLPNTSTQLAKDPLTIHIQSPPIMNRSTHPNTLPFASPLPLATPLLATPSSCPNSIPVHPHSSLTAATSLSVPASLPSPSTLLPQSNLSLAPYLQPSVLPATVMNQTDFSHVPHALPTIPIQTVSVLDSDTPVSFGQTISFSQPHPSPPVQILPQSSSVLHLVDPVVASSSLPSISHFTPVTQALAPSTIPVTLTPSPTPIIDPPTIPQLTLPQSGISVLVGTQSIPGSLVTQSPAPISATSTTLPVSPTLVVSQSPALSSFAVQNPRISSALTYPTTNSSFLSDHLYLVPETSNSSSGECQMLPSSPPVSSSPSVAGWSPSPSHASDSITTIPDSPPPAPSPKLPTHLSTSACHTPSSTSPILTSTCETTSASHILSSSCQTSLSSSPHIVPSSNDAPLSTSFIPASILHKPATENHTPASTTHPLPLCVDIPSSTCHDPTLSNIQTSVTTSHAVSRLSPGATDEKTPLSIVVSSGERVFNRAESITATAATTTTSTTTTTTTTSTNTTNTSSTNTTNTSSTNTTTTVPSADTITSPEIVEVGQEEQQPHRCSQCPRSFKELDTLTLHLWKLHEIGTLAKCQLCEFTSPLQSRLVTHARSHISTSCLTCAVCAKRLKTRATARSHLRMHQGEDFMYKCESCSVMYSQRNNLIKHLASKHQQDAEGRALTQALVCPHCPFSTLADYKLKAHIIRRHSVDKPFKCDVCSYATTEKTALAKHKRTHTKERPYVCETCGFHAQTLSSLWRHRRTHTGEKPYECELCGQLYADSKRLRDHMYKHNNINPFMCDMCGYTCRRKDNLQTHMQKIHKVQEQRDGVPAQRRTTARAQRSGKSKRGLTGSIGGPGGGVEPQRSAVDPSQAPKNLNLRTPTHTSKVWTEHGYDGRGLDTLSGVVEDSSGAGGNGGGGGEVIGTENGGGGDMMVHSHTSFATTSSSTSTSTSLPQPTLQSPHNFTSTTLQLGYLLPLPAPPPPHGPDTAALALTPTADIILLGHPEPHHGQPLPLS
ncbi:hypothetical protein Pcinc_025184 [Petrolisthes cinctipes]|uniref:Uncharacterized protein n=1 Tax=Petrolisthes cinctipes TaxID=88211 RepID=A0AAE1FB46_PETCI|nr:hypothetical protein Pcinc_025184 [Petrolisthes cinctipes]